MTKALFRTLVILPVPSPPRPWLLAAPAPSWHPFVLCFFASATSVTSVTAVTCVTSATAALQLLHLDGDSNSGEEPALPIPLSIPSHMAPVSQASIIHFAVYLLRVSKFSSRLLLSDMDYCYRCNNKTYWAPVNSTTCYRKTIHFLAWTDWFAIFLLLLSAFGVALVLSISVIFTKNLNTPVVKASGGLTVCYIILFSHFLIFLSTVFFIDEPTEFKCKTRQALFGISFALCISCILIKSLKILLAFSFDPKLQNFLKCVYKPIPTVVTCTGIQVIICTFWLIFRAPFVKQNFSIPRAIILECNEGSIVAFGIMLSYIAALAFICFIFAFKGRKLPENYNEAKFITFGMLIYFIAWIVFIPVYATTFGKYLPAVEIIVVLISNYGILCCTFLPKCYIIIYKQETNTKSAFLKMIYTYSSKSAGSVAVSQISLDSKSSSSRATISESRKSENNSVNGNCHFQVPGQTLRKGKVLPKNTARTVARKRLSSI